MNPMLQFLNPKGNNLAAMINTFTSTMKMAKNPAIALQTMMNNNPAIQKAVEDAQKYVEENGGDVEKAYRRFTDQNGVCGDDIIQMFKK